MKNEKGGVFIFSGPSGCGKSTVLGEVLDRLEHSYFSVSDTTRKPRIGEQDGVNYHFIEREEFIDLISKDEFLEHAEYVGNFYGTPKTPIEEHVEAGDDVILDIEVQGALQVMKKRPDAVSIFIAPPSLEELEERLRNRGTDNEDKIQGRMARAREEMLLIPNYDYVVINDDVSKAVNEILEIIKKTKSERENEK